MAEGTYEYECMRAELLGIAKPDKEEFEKARAERLQQEQAEQEAAEAALLEGQEEQIKTMGGKLDELNHILSSTQQKLNRFKQTACGSLSNVFSRGSVDHTDGTPSSSATASRRNTTASGGDGGGSESGKVNETQANADDADEKPDPNADVQPVIPTEKIRNAKKDIQQKITSHLDKLDTLINKAEHADVSMSEQTKQMRKMAK